MGVHFFVWLSIAFVTLVSFLAEEEEDEEQSEKKAKTEDDDDVSIIY